MDLHDMLRRLNMNAFTSGSPSSSRSQWTCPQR